MTTYYILDTETAGLAPPKTGGSGLVEYAYMKIDPITLNNLGCAARKVNPGCMIQPGAQAVHGISYDTVKDCPVMEPLFPGENVVIIGHNTSFDLRFVAPFIDNLVGSLCTLNLARLYVPDSPNHKLTTLIDFLGLRSGTAHSAMGDVLSTHHLLLELVKRSARSLDILIKSSVKPKVIHLMPFGKHRGTPIINLDKGYVEWFLKQEIDKDLRASLEMSLKVRC